MMAAPKILKLDEVVINRIAAGEVIQRPANAIKEMIENCIDAKSKAIQVTVKSGGLKFIQIQDDGCGIRKEDMQIVCERFTTSKLSSFDDLKSISTHGFRGEALASISHIAHLTIMTRTADSQCAHKANYEDGKMVPLQPGGKAEPKPVAGNRGTQITVEDLFYNVNIRRRALKNPNEEHAKIADVISKYAIHNPSVAFTLKKQGVSSTDIRTTPDSSTVDAIKSIYGSVVSRELLEITFEDEQFGFKVNGYISNANYSIKRCIFLLFINHRLVESSSLKKSLESVYQNYLPKDAHPFMYISLEINPVNVDVNVHPTKHEVKFLHEDSIIDQIQKQVEEKLLGGNKSRHYYTQTLLPKVVSAGLKNPVSEVISEEKSTNDNSSQKKVYDHQLVRTDARERKLQAFFTPTSNISNDNSLKTASNISISEEGTLGVIKSEQNDECFDESEGNVGDSIPVSDAQKIKETALLSDKPVSVSKSQHNITRERRQSRLTSIKNLCKSIDDQEHTGLKKILEDHKFVGCVDKSLALVQHATRLYLLNIKKLSQEMFYQLLIFQFGHFGFTQLSSPAPIFDLVMLALNSPDSGWVSSDGDKDELANYVKNLLVSKATMLLEYFSFEVNENGELLAVPLLLQKYAPNWNGLPIFLLRVATEVDWDTEETCFDTFAHECSRFYAFGPDPIGADQNDDDESKQKWKLNVEHVIFPALRTCFLPPNHFSEDGTFLEVANLTDLYKVFERC